MTTPSRTGAHHTGGLPTSASGNRAERVEGLAQVAILLVVGGMAGAASFTHVHDWTMAHSPNGTPGWFGWGNAVISELTPLAAGLEIRRRKRRHLPTTYPIAVLVAAAVLSLSAQVAVAKPGPTGWLLAAVPALAFLALSKLVLSRTSAYHTDAPATDDSHAASSESSWPTSTHSHDGGGTVTARSSTSPPRLTYPRRPRRSISRRSRSRRIC
jgi:hypothetical protein